MLSTILLLAGLASAAPAQTLLTLAEAEAAALKNHPAAASAMYSAQAADAAVKQARSGFYPQLTGLFTGVGAESGTAVAAGNVTTSSVASRVASGIVVNQLLTDFGRTSQLAKSASLRADALGANVKYTRAQILLRVRQAYYRALAAQAVLRVAQETVAARRVTLKQVDALARSSLRSSLDVSFADVNVSEAELVLFRAENDIRAAYAELAAAMGTSAEQDYTLGEQAMPPPLDASADPLVEQAMKERSDLAGLRLARDAAGSFAESERRLRFPTLSALGAGGVLPAREDKLRGRYGAVGLNVTVPVLNGGLFSAWRAEADARAQAAASDVKVVELRIARDVKVAWLNANNTFRRLDVTARLLDQSTRALRLAQQRYDLGLSSIVELNQAQLAKTTAEIAASSARYEYQAQRAALEYEIGH